MPLSISLPRYMRQLAIENRSITPAVGTRCFFWLTPPLGESGSGNVRRRSTLS